jgi:tetratricopeptide repeat protein
MNFFEKLTDGLRLYEVIILVLSSLMFIALLVIMIIYVAQKRPLKPVLIFFSVPVLLLVWPSIQKIKIDGQGAEIEKQVAVVEKSPTNENIEKLKDLIDDVEDRDVKDPEVKKDVAKAHFVLGDVKKAEETLHTLPAKQAADPEVADIKKSITVFNQLQHQISEVKQNPADSNKIKALNAMQIEATKLDIKNPQVTSNIKVANEQIKNYKLVNPKFTLSNRFNN